jgi:hypothetical protein
MGLHTPAGALPGTTPLATLLTDSFIRELIRCTCS